MFFQPRHTLFFHTEKLVNYVLLNWRVSSVRLKRQKNHTSICFCGFTCTFCLYNLYLTTDKYFTELFFWRKKDLSQEAKFKIHPCQFQANVSIIKPHLQMMSFPWIYKKVSLTPSNICSCARRGCGVDRTQNSKTALLIHWKEPTILLGRKIRAVPPSGFSLPVLARRSE